MITRIRVSHCFFKSLAIKKQWTRFVCIFSFFTSLSYANSLPPLIVATEIFNPPFIMRGANNQLFGFDIEMMEYLCQVLQRECQYRPNFFENTVLTSIENHEADLGMASITVTLERSHHVNFTFPYLPSDAQYLTKKWATTPFSKEAFNGKKIGIQVGTIFATVINESDFSNVQIMNFNSTPQLINALNDGRVDFILQDALAAQYWAAQMPIFSTFGKPFIFGYGFAIAVNKDDVELLEQLNNALLEFEKNGEFQKTYDRYVQ